MVEPILAHISKSLQKFVAKSSVANKFDVDSSILVAGTLVVHKSY